MIDLQFMAKFSQALISLLGAFYLAKYLLLNIFICLCLTKAACWFTLLIKLRFVVIVLHQIRNR